MNVILTYPAVQEHCGSTIICPWCELSRSDVPDVCIVCTAEFFALFWCFLIHNTLQKDDIVNIAFTCIMETFLSTPLWYYWMIFQKFDINSFKMPLTDTVENSMLTWGVWKLNRRCISHQRGAGLSKGSKGLSFLCCWSTRFRSVFNEIDILFLRWKIYIYTFTCYSVQMCHT